jgi:hypothetical protein
MNAHITYLLKFYLKLTRPFKTAGPSQLFTDTPELYVNLFPSATPYIYLSTYASPPTNSYYAASSTGKHAGSMPCARLLALKAWHTAHNLK